METEVFKIFNHCLKRIKFEEDIRIKLIDDLVVEIKHCSFNKTDLLVCSEIDNLEDVSSILFMISLVKEVVSELKRQMGVDCLYPCSDK